MNAKDSISNVERSRQLRRGYLLEALIGRHWRPMFVERQDSQIIVELDDKLYTAAFVDLGKGQYSLLVSGKSYDIVVHNHDGTHDVSVDAIQIRLGLRDPRELRGRTLHDEGSDGPIPIAAAMPGKIVCLLVREGDIVDEGQGVIVVEAMKMQNELKAPKAGLVTAVSARENQAVNAGETLLIIGPLPPQPT